MSAHLNRLVSATLLKPCKLWADSNLESSFNYGGITIREMVKARDQLEACPDLTTDELEWLAAIKATLDKS